MDRGISAFVYFVVLSLVNIAAAEEPSNPVLVAFDAGRGAVVTEVDNSLISFQDDQTRLIVWTEGNLDRWSFFTGSWKRPSKDAATFSSTHLAEASRSSSFHFAAGIETIQSTTTVLPQLRSGAVTRGAGDLVTPYDGGVHSNARITIRRQLAKDDGKLQPATATIFKNGEELLRVPIPADVSKIIWQDIKNLPPSLSDGLKPGVYELELKPTPTGVQRISFEIVELAVQRQLLDRVRGLKTLLSEESPIPTQLAVEEFLRHKPALLSDALNSLESFESDKYTRRLIGLRTHVRERLADPGQQPKLERYSGPPTGDSEIDAVRDLIAVHDWETALDDLELIEADSQSDDKRRLLLVQLYRGVILSQSGSATDKEVRNSFGLALRLLPNQSVTQDDRFRVYSNYANFLVGRVTDRLSNHAFQIAAGVPHPIVDSLYDWMEANQQLELASHVAASPDDKTVVELNACRLNLLLADIVSTLSNVPRQSNSFLDAIWDITESKLKELTTAGDGNRDFRVVAIATEMRAQLELRRGNLESAKSTARAARNLFTQNGDLIGIESSERLLGLISATDSNGDSRIDALRHFKISEKLSEILRDRVFKDASGESIAGFMGRRYYVNEQIVDLLASQGEAKQALLYAERAKARAFSDILAASNDSPSATAEFSVDDAIKDWPADTVMLEYFLTSSNCWLFEISITGDVKVEKLALPDGRPIAPRDLVEKSRAAREMLNNYKFQWQDRAQARHFNDAWQHQLHELHGILLPSKVSESLTGVRRVVVVPHHILHYVPFAALVTRVDEGANKSQMALPRFLLDEPFTISYSPSLATWRLLDARQVSAIERVGIVADTRAEAGLREVATEVSAIEKAFKDRSLDVYEAGRATIGNAISVLENADLAFFGCHGQNKWDSPLDGALLLADGNLSANSLLEIDVDADVVILSACHSGLADQSPLPGDDLFGLERVLLSRGAQCVVSGNWLVDDLRGARITSAMIAKLATGDSADHALAHAQRSILKRYRFPSDDDRLRFFSHPHYWAVYKLSGVFKGRPERVHVATKHAKDKVAPFNEGTDSEIQESGSTDAVKSEKPEFVLMTRNNSVLIRNAASGFIIYFEIDGRRYDLSSRASRWLQVRDGRGNLRIVGGKRNGDNSRQPHFGGGFTTGLISKHTYDLVKESSSPVLPQIREPGFVARDRGIVSVGEGNSYQISIQNSCAYSIRYELNGTSFTAEPHKTRWHSTNEVNKYAIEFDSKFAKGFQGTRYRLLPGSQNYFKEVNNGIDLYR